MTPGSRWTTAACAAALSAFAVFACGTDSRGADDDDHLVVQLLVARAAQKNAAFMNGDMRRWAELVSIAPDFTLMQPFGGPSSHGFDASPERLADMARTFHHGETGLEIEQSYAVDGMVVLVMIERQLAAIGPLPMQDWSLRVTEVYRRDAGEWRLVHRHADPLTAPRSLDETARLARGAATPPAAVAGEG